METAMEQRNATATLASYGQDTGDFGPETDVDTPDDQISLTKPLKVEGEANVIDESGEDSEEDGGGWNYYKKSDTEDTTKKVYQGEVNDQITGTNFDAEDMDYKLNPDAPEFVPVSSPPANHAQRFLNMDNDDFISSSPQKYKESIENVDVPDENDFTNEIKVHAADLSKLNNPFEPSDESTMLNGIKSLNEDVTEQDETENSFVFQNEHISNHNSNEYQKPFHSGNKIDLDQVQDLTDLVDYDNEDEDTQNNTYKSDPFISIMETSKINEFISTNGNNELQNESDIKLNNDFSLGEHIKYEHDMNSKNVDDTISTVNATIGSTLQFDDTSFKHDEDLRNEFSEENHIDKSAQYDSYNKLNDSVSTTGAVLGSEPNTPIQMDNQSTFESENDDDQFSEPFKQRLQFNQFDENNDKENHDPFCFEQTEDPAGIIPNVVHEVNEVVHETHHDDTFVSNDSSNEKQGSESIKHEPVDEPICIKEKAKPIHSVYEQEYLPESDFSASTHEALLNTTESVSNQHENNINTEQLEQQIIENHVETKQEYDGEYQKVDEHLKQDQYTLDNYRDHYSLEPKDTDDVELEDSDVDEIKYHAEGLKQEFDNDDTSDYEAEKMVVNSVHNEIENLSSEHNSVSDENKHVVDVNLEKNAADYIENHIDNSETMMPIEDININPAHNVADDLQNFVKDSLQSNYDIIAIQNSTENIERGNVNDSEIKPSKARDNLILVDEFNKETLENILRQDRNNDGLMHGFIEYEKRGDVYEIVHRHIHDCVQEVEVIAEISGDEDFREKVLAISEMKRNQVNNFQQEIDFIPEVEHNLVNDFKQENDVISEDKHSLVDDIKQESHANFEVKDSLVNDFKQKSHVISEVEDSLVNDFKQKSHVISEVEDSLVNDFEVENPDISEVKHSAVDDLKQEDNFNKVEHNDIEDVISEHLNTTEIAYNNIDSKQEPTDVDKIENNSVENLKQNYSVVSEFVQGHNDDFQEHHEIESVQNHTVDSDEEMHSSMIIHSNVENNIPQPYCSANDALLIKEPDMMCTSMTFEENFQNRNMSDSLYVMETSSDYFGEEIQPNTQFEKSVDEPKAEEQSSNIDNEHIESEKIQNEILTETKSELDSESKVEEVKTEATEMNKLSSIDVVEKVDVQEENNKVAEIAVAAAVGAATVAAVTGVSLASKKSAPKKIETTVSKAKTTTTKTTSPKPLVSKSSAPILKKTTALSTTSKPLSRPTTTPSTTSKPTANVRPTTALKTTALKSTTAPIKTAPKPAAKTSTTMSRPAPTKTTPTTARVSLTKTTPTASPKTPTSPKTASATKLTTTAKTTPRTSTSISKQPLTNGSPKPASRPISAPAKKTLSSTTNGTTKLTNGDVSKVSSTTKPPISLATRMSLAPPKLPPKVKVAPKTAPPAAMPGPIRRPKAPITKKTETATS
ncbi:Hypothetical protein CINCED_3A015692 [Cinara cedri]|nr:Hypothetical protein CINCED_3A015692 [Cinara cedri]